MTTKPCSTCGKVFVWVKPMTDTRCYKCREKDYDESIGTEGVPMSPNLPKEIQLFVDALNDPKTKPPRNTENI